MIAQLGAPGASTPTRIAQATATFTPPANTVAPTEPPTKTPIPPSPIPTLGIGSTKITADGATMLFVPAGEFRMGSTDQEISYTLTLCPTCSSTSFNDEKQHTVYLSAFWIDKFEVTNAQYKKCVDAGKCTVPSRSGSSDRPVDYDYPQFDNFPVSRVLWEQAKTYCISVGKRLPTEAEWEKAASWDEVKGEKRRYPWGNEFDGTRLGSLSSQPPVIHTSAVGSYPSGASPFGAMDMAGNVWEWVADWYDFSYYTHSPRENPMSLSGQSHVVRGGSWNTITPYLRTTARIDYGVTGDKNDWDIGFRCAQ